MLPFDFLGYRFGNKEITGLTTKTIKNFIEKTARIYEQGATDQRIICYIKRWCSWTQGKSSGKA